MKHFVFLLLLTIGIFSCKKETVSEPTATTEASRPGNGKGKGQQTTLSVINLTATVYGRDSIVLDWDTPPMNSGDYIMWTFVNRKLTLANGQVFLLKDGYGLDIQGSEWQSIMPGGYMYQPTRYVITNTAGLTTSGLVPGVWELYVSGGTGLPYDSQNWAIYLTNHVTVTVL